MALRRHYKRQVNTTPSVPSLDGFAGASTVAETNTASGLLFNPSATPAPIPIQVTVSVTNAVSDTQTLSTATPAPAGEADSSASSSSQISLGTVIGACVGAFAAVALVLLLVWWSIRRSRSRKGSYSHPSSKSKPQSSSTPVSDNLNSQQNKERRKSARQTWLKMRDDDEEKYAMRETNQGAGGDVARSVTMKTYRTDKSYGPSLGLAHTFAPDPVPQLEFTDPEMGMVRPPFARGGENDPISWGGETVVHNSFLSLKSSDGIDLGMSMDKSGSSDDETMSPSIVVSKQTRQATTDVVSAHHWEEAEFVTPSVEMNSMFAHQQDADSERSNVIYSTPDSSPISFNFEPENPFKSRNPFDDDHAISSNTSANTHLSADNLPAGERGDRAMQSLLAALAISEEDAKERLAAATQPTPRASIQSQLSSNTIMSASNFPMPPGH